MKCQMTFASSGGCERFSVNKMRLNLPKGAYVCSNCGLPLAEHQSAAASDEDVAGFLAHLGSRDGGSCIIDTCSDTALAGKVYLGSFASSVNPFVSKYRIGAVVNCSDLHLSDRTDFQHWAKKVEDLESIQMIRVLRLGWADLPSQKLWRISEWDQLIDAIRFIHAARKEGKNVSVHCAQGKSRSATVMLAYMLAVDSTQTLDKALSYVQGKRSIVQPNPGFFAQLQDFERSPALTLLREELRN